MVGIIAPTGGFKKYVTLVLSLMLIALIIEPIAVFINKGEDILGGSYLRLESELNAKSLADGEAVYEDEYEQKVLEQYKQNLNEQTKQVIKAQTGFAVVDAAVIVDERPNSENYANIEGVHVVVSVSYEGGYSALEQIAMGAAAQPEGQDAKQNTEQIIKKCLMDFYNLPEGNIHITVG